jgi:hypothetical protein
VKSDQEEVVGNLVSRRVASRAALAAAAVAAVGAAVPAAGGAATVVPTSFTGCHGTLAADSSNSDEPNLLDYSFSCNSGITAYSILVSQQRSAGGALDDFGNSPSVFETDGVTPSPTESLTCAGVTPSNGINCATPALGSQITLGYTISGSIDLINPYCKHLPTTLNNGKPATPGSLATPTATVWVLVTDYTGGQNGPFRLKLDKACPKVPSKVPVTTSTTPTKKPAQTTTSSKPKAHRASRV